MEDCNSNTGLPGGATANCPPSATQDARRRKIPPEMALNMLQTSQTQKINKKLPPPPPSPSNSQGFDLDPPAVVVAGGSTFPRNTEDEALKAFGAALDEICGDEEVPESTPENAPFDLVLDFMAAVMKEDFEHALKLANLILKYEPTNSTVAEYLPILQELIQLEQQESDSSCTTDSDESGSEDESCSSSESESEDEESPSSASETEDGESTREVKGQDEADEESDSTVASDEYLSEYGEDYEHPVVPGEDDGYETNETGQLQEEAGEE